EASYELEKADKIAKKLGNAAYQADVLIEKARLLNQADDYLQAKKTLDQATALIPKSEFSYLNLMSIYYSGYIEFNLGNFSKAITCLKEILSKPETERFQDIRANMHALIGKIYVERGEFQLATDYYLNAAKVMEKLQMKRELGRIYCNIAWLYFKQFNDPETINFVKKAQHIGHELNDLYTLAHSHSILGSLYTDTGKFEEAIQEHQVALDIRKKMGSRAGTSESLYNLSTVHEKMGELDKALFFANQCLVADEVLGNTFNLGLSLKKMTSLYLKLNKPDSAWHYLNRAESCARKTSSLELNRDVDLLKSEWYERAGDYQSAVKALRSSIRTNDSIYNALNIEKTAEIRGLFDLENIELKSKQKEQQLEIQRIALASQQNKFVLFNVILVLVTSILAVSIFFYFVTRNQNRKLKEEIAERGKAEAQILKSQIQYEEAQALAHVGSWEYNLQNGELTWSKETYRIFELEGCPADQLYQSWWSRCHPDDQSKLGMSIQQTLDTGLPFSIEHRIVLPGNRIHYISCLGEVIKDQEGKVIGIRGTDQNVTMQKKADMAKSEFLSIMSHEIRTPINGVIGISNLLKQEKLTATQKEYVDTLNFSAMHLSTIVSDILDFSKIETGNLTLEKVPFQVKEVIENVFKLFENKAGEKGVHYKLLMDPASELTLKGDYFRLSQIISNLLSNAIKFTEQGAVTLSCRVREQKADLCYLQFTVTDTGIGIPEEQQTKVFDKFSQADVSINRKFGGTGLGLAISKKLTELMGGKITVASTSGNGSVFTVELPFERSEPITIVATEPTQQSQLALTGLRVLAAEDNQVNLLVLTRFLKNWGVEFTVAKDGAEAL
ncbi:MAG: tetratricopeptide repeat protein, partial [Saprospiraceae bacterium]|nr:tetratricopeptide repeat protein [Saprospiraceae bacterium]